MPSVKLQRPPPFLLSEISSQLTSSQSLTDNDWRTNDIMYSDSTVARHQVQNLLNSLIEAQRSEQGASSCRQESTPCPYTPPGHHPVRMGPSCSPVCGTGQEQTHQLCLIEFQFKKVFLKPELQRWSGRLVEVVDATLSSPVCKLSEWWSLRVGIPHQLSCGADALGFRTTLKNRWCKKKKKSLLFM